MTQTQTYYPNVARTIVLTAKLKKKISNVFPIECKINENDLHNNEKVQRSEKLFHVSNITKNANCTLTKE